MIKKIWNKKKGNESEILFIQGIIGSVGDFSKLTDWGQPRTPCYRGAPTCSQGCRGLQGGVQQVAGWGRSEPAHATGIKQVTTSRSLPRSAPNTLVLQRWGPWESLPVLCAALVHSVCGCSKPSASNDRLHTSRLAAWRESDCDLGTACLLQLPLQTSQIFSAVSETGLHWCEAHS